MLKIYIANLGKYNEGELVGKWVELPCEDLDEVLKEIEVVDGTAYEEYAIHDYESDIEGLNIDPRSTPHVNHLLIKVWYLLL